LKAALGTLGIEGKALFVDSRDNANFARASRNVRSWKLVDALGVNAYDVLAHGTVVLTKSAFSRVVKNLGGE
jgi:large subunit ribosomal protein L4